MTTLKTIYLLIGLSLWHPHVAWSAVFTVSNNPDIPAQYGEIQLALENASAGDTLYVSGSNTSYGTITINKRITLLGAGYHPNNQLSLPTNLLRVYFDTIPDISGASGSKIIGFDVSFINIRQEAFQDIEISRCNIGINLTLNAQSRNWLIRNCIISGSILFQNSSGMVVANNIISGSLRASTQNFLISNNVFVGGGASFTSISNASIANNIFYGKNAQGCNQCVFSNNISFGSTSDNSIIYGDNTGTGNLEGVDPKFVQVPLRESMYLEYDYRLAADSPGIGAGTDETDIGIYGGFFSFPSEITGEPPIPQIETFLILNPVVGEGGQLRFNSTATSKP